VARHCSCFYRSWRPFAPVVPRREALAARFGQRRNSLRSNSRRCFSSASQRLPTPQNQSSAQARHPLCIHRGLGGLAERNMDGAAGNPPWSAPHESRSLPTVNLRSGRFVRAPARWVAAGVPWSVVRHCSPPRGRSRGRKSPQPQRNGVGECANIITFGRTRPRRHITPHCLKERAWNREVQFD